MIWITENLLLYTINMHKSNLQKRLIVVCDVPDLLSILKH